MNVLNTRPMKVALRYILKVFGPIHLSNDKFLTLKNVKNIETMNLLNSRLMKVALRYF
jgi:hypothetical protein